MDSFFKIDVGSKLTLLLSSLPRDTGLLGTFAAVSTLCPKAYLISFLGSCENDCLAFGGSFEASLDLDLA